MADRTRFLLLMLMALTAGCGKEAVPAGYRTVTSAHDRYTYLVPVVWERTGFNCIQGETGKVIEQILPSAEVDEDYCTSLVFISAGDIEELHSESALYFNGHINGCLTVRDMRNTAFGTSWRHTGFHFETAYGVESVTVITSLEETDSSVVMTIIDSVSML